MSEVTLDDVTSAVAGLSEGVETLSERQLSEERVREIVAEATEVSGYTPPESEEVAVTAEREMYGPRGERSFFADLAAAKSGSTEARERLAKQREIVMKTRDLSSTATAGGEFVAPIYLQDEFIKLARAARPTADAVMHAPLPPDTGSINLPRMSTGSAVATQSDLGAVQETDAVTANVNVPVRTIAGQQDVSRQLFDRSVPGVDQVLLADLAADYATKLDVQVLNGSGTAPNAKGILQATGINAVTYTDLSPTVPELYPKIADAIQQIHTGRFLPPSVIVMHPRRWGWVTASLDSQNRPLVPPSAAVNAVAQLDRVASQAVVGMLQGLPVIVDASIPTNLGAGTNEDIIIVARAEDLWLFEDAQPNEATYFEVLSSTLAVRLQVWGYFAFTAERYPKAVSTVGGTGLVAPTF